ncbi:DUF1861 family protein [Cohnella cholangitidis]|uniref:DUF1861 family protein n=1 Tax=Cohnella cholangitidis TaxID=2598458 RepID=A0A7G5BWJ5_9BACL|nr:DUF1861 family protein [Cohnella cholangitidis]QMV41329.1 DUF1861 family protein [Cohnella cholangitidis]
MIPYTEQAKSSVDLLNEFLSVDRASRGRKLVFSGVGRRDVYNISAPFMDDGEPVIAGRVEDRGNESSEVMFFVERSGEWVPRNGAPVFALQDPFFTFIDGQLVFGGVEVYFDGDDPHYVTSWCTVFYRGYSINDLEPFAKGPRTMKDIRLVELANGRIGVFTRPMMVEGARALIGYTEIGALEELSEDVISEAGLLRHQFLPEEWGGANEAHLLKNGIVGVLGHIARMEDNNIRHYYPMVFAYNTVDHRYSPIKLIATRGMFPDGPAKRPDLVDVIFSGGLVRHKDGTASLYTGVSDAEAHVIDIPDPFLEYET